ncbi:Imm52 family immunity protein [Haliangium sp.]|uniref:Imm52 family immunity protein n=1 Tax=Haliangium sp. TaxID=2663208 RepID=UPI003D13C137
MKNKFKAVAYWGSRKESIEQCTERLTRFMTQIGRLSPHLRDWHEDSRLIEKTPERLRRLLEEGRNRDETPQRRILANLGFRIFFLWAGDHPDGDIAIMTVHCGAYGEYCSVNNAILRSLPESWLDVDLAVELMRVMVTCWSPAHAAVCSPDALAAVGGQAEIPVVDWVFYHRLQRTGELSPPSRVAFELDGGECIVVQDSPIRPESPEDRARVLALSRQLGLIRGRS